MPDEYIILIYPFSADSLRIQPTSGATDGAVSVNVGAGIKEFCMNSGQPILSKAVFVDGIERIEGFNNCTNLTDVTIPDSVKHLATRGYKTFERTPFWDACTSNHMVVMGKVAVGVSGYGFNDEVAITIPNNILYVNDYFVTELENIIITSLTLPVGLKEIGDYAFANQYMPNAFTSVTIPASVTSIGDSAFYSDFNLSTLTFASGSVLESIGDSAFNGCGLTSVTIPASVISIGDGAFSGCQSLTEIHFAGNTPPTIATAIADTGVMIIVPVGAKSAYETAGYTNVYEEGHIPQNISLTWETGAINPSTGADATDSNAERSNSTSSLSAVYSVKWALDSGAYTYKLMVCCYNKSDGTYAGTYNGTSVVQGESWLHANDWDDTWEDDLSSLTAYDFRFVLKGKWGSAAGQGQNVVVYGIE